MLTLSDYSERRNRASVSYILMCAHSKRSVASLFSCLSEVKRPLTFMSHAQTSQANNLRFAWIKPYIFPWKLKDIKPCRLSRFHNKRFQLYHKTWSPCTNRRTFLYKSLHKKCTVYRQKVKFRKTFYSCSCWGFTASVLNDCLRMIYFMTIHSKKSKDILLCINTKLSRL